MAASWHVGIGTFLRSTRRCGRTVAATEVPSPIPLYISNAESFSLFSTLRTTESSQTHPTIHHPLYGHLPRFPLSSSSPSKQTQPRIPTRIKSTTTSISPFSLRPIRQTSIAFPATVYISLLNLRHSSYDDNFPNSFISHRRILVPRARPVVALTPFRDAFLFTTLSTIAYTSNPSYNASLPNSFISAEYTS